MIDTTIFNQADLSDIVLNTAEFDADWYRATFEDAAASDLSPMAHFLIYGQWLGRGVSARLPEGKDVSELLGVLQSNKTISYCIPIMHRPDDIRQTLATNLEQSQNFQSEVEFILMFLDDDVATHQWAKEQFRDAVRAGYLRVITAEPLTEWHFGRAKNAFKNKLRGSVYSSLDGDNFVTGQETEQLLDLCLASGDEKFVVHHFSGNWGDGSSGRVSLPRALYEKVGYDNHLLPRQFDEVDLILSTVVRQFGTKLIRYDTKDHIFSSKRCAAFAATHPRLPPQTQILPDVPRMDPGNPKGPTYVAEDRVISAMLDFNQAVCFWKNALSASRPAYIEEVFKARRKLLDVMPRERLLPTIVSPLEPARLPTVQPDEVSLFSSVKDDEHYLAKFYAHYKQLGVRHFFLIDDGSKTPIGQVLPHRDVHVFRPQTGSFATSKGLWLGALMKFFLQEGMWALTVDADEFLDLAPSCPSLRSLTARVEKAGAEFVPALLIDMLPTSDAGRLRGADFNALFRAFTCHGFEGNAPSEAYVNHPSIKWGFGPYAEMSWAFDARFHAYATFDSLRKIPLFRYQAGLHLNQGLHDLHYTDARRSPGSTIWSNEYVLPMRHYKTLKIFLDEFFSQHREVAKNNAYHHRTAENIAAIFGRGKEEALKALADVPKRMYSIVGFAEQLSKFRAQAGNSADSRREMPKRAAS